MAVELSIYDVSPFIYCANYVNKYADKKNYGFKIGGLQYLMKFVSLDLSVGKDVVLCFDSRSFRKDLLQSYKASRTPNHEVFAQLKLAYDLLPKCGIVCYKKDGYEADDLIYNIVQAQKKNYYKIRIYGSDYDLAHNVDERTVTFESMSSQVNSIDCRNFSTSIEVGKRIMFNTITAYKILFGDKSDEYKAFVSTKGIQPSFLYTKFQEMLKAQPTYPPAEITSSRRTFEAFVNWIKPILSNEDLEELKLRMGIAFPAEIHDMDFSQVTSLASINKDSMASFLALTRDTTSCKSLRLPVLGLTEQQQKYLSSLSHQLKTGEFAVDNNLSVNPVNVGTKMINMREF